MSMNFDVTVGQINVQFTWRPICVTIVVKEHTLHCTAVYPCVVQVQFTGSSTGHLTKNPSKAPGDQVHLCNFMLRTWTPGILQSESTLP
jgi:hypothetical protein